MSLTPAKGLLVKDWKENVINLIQFPRTKVIPTPSPFSLKLETFLKFVKLPYTNVSNEFKWGSAKGQIPFIELNGRQHADSGTIINYLINEYKLDIDAGLNAKESADIKAYTVLVEKSLVPGNLYLRHMDPSWLFTDDKGMGGNFTGIKHFLASNFGPMAFKKSLAKTLQADGMGRNSVEEALEIIKKDLLALNTFLAGKKFFGGDRPISFDATVFGIVSEYYFPPQPIDTIVNFITTETPGLRALLERIKADYWPEWDEITQNLLMNAKTPEERAEEALKKAEIEQSVSSEKAALRAAEATIVHETAKDRNEI